MAKLQLRATLLATAGDIAASVLELPLRRFALHKRDAEVLAWLPASTADGHPWPSALRRGSCWCSRRRHARG
ncbi:hypothetical protein CFC21_034995 [Triticum aestivum]|uniref:Uncharacterized protein n=3 Tax=Triticum TaxID=4564 RepID=A0A9R0RHK2_TRITD|nr:hypothetical protein CFC21_034995 [Triticum aestivum]VAH59794.1 unnamed protein product [Triticum turgidum subsp. durum]